MGLSHSGFRRSLAVLLLVVISAGPNWGYSVLTHEQIVDVLWKDGIQPLLLKRFPHSTEDELRQAHAYAYGGSVLQDMGYYPFGSKYFSDLVHYVRSGDFVEALIRDSSDLNEYAFALGALSHYAADASGHPTINRVTAIEFPKLKRKFGPEVTYADDPKAHIQTEFGFDMVQVAKNRYTSDHFHDFIGFEVSRPVLERAFFETYNLKLEDVFGNVDLAIGSYRRGVSQMIPQMTRVALLSRRQQMVKDTPNFNKKEFLYYLSRAQYEKQWGSVYRKPGVGARILAFFLKIVPKVGPFKAVDFKIPTQRTEDMYIKSVDETVQDYTKLLHEIHDQKIQLRNIDFDTGRDTRAGEYVLTDKTYAKLAEDLADKSTAPVPPDLRANVLQFYSNGNASLEAGKDKKNKDKDKKNQKDREKLQRSLAKLRQQVPPPAPRPSSQ